jgi:hypothetical protein
LVTATALAAAVWAAHGGALSGAFHYDDTFTVVNNPAVRSWQPARYFTRLTQSSASERLGYSR